MRLRGGCCISGAACSVAALTSLVAPPQPSQPGADPEYSTAQLQRHRRPRGGGGRNKGGWILSRINGADPASPNSGSVKISPPFTALFWRRMMQSLPKLHRLSAANHSSHLKRGEKPVTKMEPLRLRSPSEAVAY